MKKLIISNCLFFVLAGCAATPSMIPVEVVENTVDTVSSGSTKKIKFVAEASVAKEQSVHKTLQHRDTMIAVASQYAGLKMDWKSVEKTYFFPGMDKPIIVTEYLPIVSYKEMPNFNQALPTAPSEHPGWRTATELGKSLVDGTIIGLGIHEGAGVLKTAFRSAGNRTEINSGGGRISGSGNMTTQRQVYKAGGNIASTTTAKPCQGENCKGSESGESLDTPEDMPDYCPAGAVYGKGIWWADKIDGCSCESRKEKRC